MLVVIAITDSMDNIDHIQSYQPELSEYYHRLYLSPILPVELIATGDSIDTTIGMMGIDYLGQSSWYYYERPLSTISKTVIDAIGNTLVHTYRF